MGLFSDLFSFGTSKIMAFNMVNKAYFSIIAAAEKYKFSCILCTY